MFYLPLTGGCSAWLVSAAFPAQLTRIIGRWRSRATLRGSKPPAEWSFLRTNTPQVAATIGFFAADKNQRRRLSAAVAARSEEHTSELQSLVRNSYDVVCLNKNKQQRSDGRGAGVAVGGE